MKRRADAQPIITVELGRLRAQVLVVNEAAGLVDDHELEVHFLFLALRRLAYVMSKARAAVHGLLSPRRQGGAQQQLSVVLLSRRTSASRPLDECDSCQVTIAAAQAMQSRITRAAHKHNQLAACNTLESRETNMAKESSSRRLEL